MTIAAWTFPIVAEVRTEPLTIEEARRALVAMTDPHDTEPAPQPDPDEEPL